MRAPWRSARQSRNGRASKQPRDEIGRFCDSKSRGSADHHGKQSVSYVTRTNELGKSQDFAQVKVDGRTYEIPVDQRGCVPEYALMMRFSQVKDGDRAGAERSMARDLDQTAEKTLKLGAEIRPEQIAAWWAHPNESDLVGIDDETTKVYGTDGAVRKSSLPYQRRIGIAGTPAERKMVRKTLDGSFTAGELKKLTDGGSTYQFAYEGRSRLGANSSGCYSPNDGLIVIKKGSTPGTVVHETTHRLRHVDSGRTGAYTTSKIDDTVAAIKKGSTQKAEYLRSVEEAGTECETVARLSPYRANGSRVSYYSFLTRDGGRAKAMIDQDRRTLVGNDRPDGKGLKGRKAVAAVEKNFTKTNISNYGYNGKKAREYKRG